MELISLFDDYPLVPSRSYAPRLCRKRSRMPSLWDTFEDQIDQRIGYIFRNIPALLTADMDDLPPIKRKCLDGKSLLCSVEPKCKAQVSTENGKFQVQMDTSDFNPENITVKVVGDKLGISAKHESKTDDSYEFHEMYRSFSIPEGINADTITSKLSSNGQLIVEAPLKALKDNFVKRTVPIDCEKKAVQSIEKS